MEQAVIIASKLIGRITDVRKVTDLSSDFSLADLLFTIFIVPKSQSDLETDLGEGNVESDSVLTKGDIITVEGYQPYGEDYAEVPVVVGDWSPVVFKSLKADTIDLDYADVYVGVMDSILWPKGKGLL